MSGVNAHLLLSQYHRQQPGTAKPPPALNWQHSRHSIAPLSHPLLEVAVPLTTHHPSFSFRLKAAEVSSLHSCKENDRPVIPSAALMQMAAAAMSSLQEAPALGCLQAIAFPLIAWLPAPSSPAASSILMLSCNSSTGLLSLTRPQQAPALLMSASCCITHKPTPATKPAEGQQPNPVLQSLIRVARVAAAPQLAAMDQAPLLDSPADRQTACLAAALGIRQSAPLLAAADAFLPELALPQETALHASVTSTGQQTADVFVGLPGRSMVSAAHFRPAISSAVSDPAQALMYEVEMQASFPSAVHLPASVPSGENPEYLH